MTDNGLGQKVATTDGDAAVPASPSPIVNVGACRCPGTPHPDGDTVTLADEASMTMGLRTNGAISKANDDEALLQLYMGRVLIEEGIESWSFVEQAVDGEGKLAILPAPVTPENIERLLPWGRGGMLVSEAANTRYWDAIVAPLVKRSQAISGPGPTNGSTSHTKPSRAMRRSSSKSSSPASLAVPR